MLVLDRLGKVYPNGVNALERFSAEIRLGEIVAIIGGSGCGKSTLLRAIAGLDRATSGTVTLDDIAISAPHAKIGIIFQEPRLLPWQRVAHNVEVGLSRAHTMRDRRRQAEDALAQVGLDGRGHHWPAVLSGGQKQRVALARALVSHPKLLLLDEPLGALDALTRIEMQDLVTNVWQDKGFTAIMVTHDVSEAVALADRILLLKDGKVALDIDVDLPRPRRHGDPSAARIEGRILDQLLRR